MNKDLLLEKENRRYEVLRWIFDKANGDEGETVDLNELADQTADFVEKRKQEEGIVAISDYWKGKELINQIDDSGLIVELTHKGVEEIEDSIKNPQKSTENISSQVVYNYIGGNNYGNFQQFGTNNFQNNTLNESLNIEQKINELIEAVNRSNLSALQKIKVESDLETIQKLTRMRISS